jgi:hypothetical protein
MLFGNANFVKEVAKKKSLSVNQLTAIENYKWEHPFAKKMTSHGHGCWFFLTINTTYIYSNK